MRKVDKRNIEDIFALTPMQEGMLFHYLKERGRNHYFEQLSLEMSGEIDIQRFEQAWNFVIQTNEMLRAVFRWEMVENPVQMVLKEYRLEPKYYDFSKKRSEKKQKFLEEIKTKDRQETFDLRHVPFRVTLCKMDEGFYEMVVSNHHMLYDGWSSGIILKEFLEAYNQLFLKNRLIPPVKSKFKEFVKWIQNQDLQEEEKYWKEYLAGFDVKTDISIKRKAGEEINETGSYLFPFFSGKKDMLEHFVRAHKITLASVLYGAWGILLQKINDSDDVMFGATVSGRSANVKGIENIVGLFINTIPLRVRTQGDSNSDNDEKIGDLVYRINDILRVREKYESTSLVKIKEWIGVTNEPLFDSIVVVENYPLYVGLDNHLGKKNGGLSIDSYSMFEMTHYDLAVGISIFSDIEVRFVYNKGRFDEQAINTLCNGFTSIVKDIIDNPEKEISRVEIISGEEKRRILFDFNDTQSDYPSEKTIPTLFETQVERNVNKIAVLYEDEQLSYHELNRRATQLGRLLREKGVTADTIVGLMVERSIEMMVGIFGILKAGGAYLPIDPNYPEERIKYILNDSNARILVSKVSRKLAGLCPEVIDLNRIKAGGVPFSLFFEDHPATRNSQLATSSENIAYVIYTSGSTGNPKGVMIEHKQLVNFISHMYNGYNRDFDCHDRCLSLTNITFDVCVCELFLPIAFGSCIVLLSEKKKFNVNDLAETILDKGITFAYIPPGLLKELNTELKPHTSKLRLNKMLVGVEPIRDDGLEDYLALNESMFILNGYGPTETTICSTIFPYRSHEPEGKIVPIGRPLSNTTILILDRKGCLMPLGVPGEICISGDGKGRGYLNNPDLTAEKFVDNPFEPGKRMYRTGDRGKWLPDGNIQFLGRMDSQVKIRGYRIELGEIENQLLRYKGIKETVVMAREDKKGDKYLCAYVVPDSLSQQAADSLNSIDAIPSTRSISLNVSELRDFVSNRLPHYMIPAYFIQIEEIPLTPNGKIERKALPEPQVEQGDTYAAPRDHLERKLVEIWSEVLDVEPTNIGIDDDFFSLGGHSLKATPLISKIHKEMNVNLPIDSLFENPTIRALAGYVKEAKQELYVSIPTAEKREYYPLSAAQKRLYITQHMKVEGLAYNVQNAVWLEGSVSREMLEEAFRKLIERHESFRTSFEMIDDEPVQRINDEVEFKIEYYDLTAKRREDTRRKDENHYSSNQFIEPIHHFVRPFDLSQAPLLRVGFIETGEEKHILMMDMHHIIGDFFSMSLFIKDFSAFCRNEELPPLNLQYKDFSLWQNIIGRKEQNETLNRQETYWLEMLEGEVPVLNLPFDYARPAIQQFGGSVVFFELDRETTALLKKMALEEEVTRFMVLLAVFNILLARVCDQEDILVGTPVAGRRHADLQSVIGFFVNTLVIRNQPGIQKTFQDFLKEVKAKTLKAYENQDYPYETLVDKLTVERDGSRNAVFDVLFVWEGPELELGYIPSIVTGAGTEGLKLKPCKLEKRSAIFDMIFTGSESGENIHFSINYKTSLFKRKTIESIGKNFKEVLRAIVTDRNIKMEDIAISHGLIAVKSQALIEDRGDFGF